MTIPRKLKAGAALAAVLLMGAAALDGIVPVKHRYTRSKPWFLDIEPGPEGTPHDWNRYFPYETGEYNMLHVPDKFEFKNRIIEIVQGNEKDRFEVGKEIFVNAVAEKDFSLYLFKLHLHAADMVIEEQYKTRKGLIKMVGYSVDTEYLSDGKFLGKITLYSGRTASETK